jgi:hypothetical protein
MRPIGVPEHLPLNRAEAIARGVQGPTKDDVAHFNKHCKTHLVESSQCDPWDVGSKSRMHDPDWFRAVECPKVLPSRQSLHPPGTFTGRWQGSHIVRFFVPLT